MAEPVLTVQVFWQPEDGPALLRQARVAPGATLGDAVEASGVAAQLPDAGWRQGHGALRLAVFGRARTASAPVRDGDRVDVLRALRVEPKDARRRRARS